LTHFVTAEEFAQRADAKRSELINGEVVERMPPGAQHGVIAALIAFLLQTWNRQGARGYVGVESGFILSRDPDTVRGPDVFYVSRDRIPVGGISGGFWQQAPELAVEVVSPNEAASEVRAKVRDFLASGTSLVWVVYPDSREVIAHTPDGLARTYGPDATLEFPDLLPGFSCTVAQVMGEESAS
jgi:Uma2 family endonuclease